MEVRSKIWLAVDGEAVFGSGREALFKAIDKLGSINKAAKDINISYRKALSYIQLMEQRLGKKLVERQTGGLNGGGASLTDDAREFMQKYEMLEEPNRVHLISVGRVGPPALHAAALEPVLFASVALQRCLVSWSSVLSAPMATNQFENVVHGALKTYDLPDLLAALPKARVTISDPLDLL